MFPQIFSSNDQKLAMFYLISNRIFGNLFVNGKEPQSQEDQNVSISSDSA